MLLRIVAYTQTRQKKKGNKIKVDAWIFGYLSLKGLSHTEQLGVVEDEEEMHTDDSANQYSRHSTEPVEK